MSYRSYRFGWSYRFRCSSEITSFPPSVRVSLEKFRSLPASYLEDNEVDGEEEEEEEEKIAPTPSPLVSKGRRRSKGVPVGMATKHDPVVCGRRNARNMEKVT